MQNDYWFTAARRIHILIWYTECVQLCCQMSECVHAVHGIYYIQQNAHPVRPAIKNYTFLWTFAFLFAHVWWVWVSITIPSGYLAENRFAINSTVFAILFGHNFSSCDFVFVRTGEHLHRAYTHTQTLALLSLRNIIQWPDHLSVIKFHMVSATAMAVYWWWCHFQHLCFFPSCSANQQTHTHTLTHQNEICPDKHKFGNCVCNTRSIRVLSVYYTFLRLLLSLIIQTFLMLIAWSIHTRTNTHHYYVHGTVGIFGKNKHKISTWN